MQAKKTHEQQLRIIEKRNDTANAGADFDMDADLARSEAGKAALQGGENLRAGLKNVSEDRGMIGGESQDSRHHKRAGAGH